MSETRPTSNKSSCGTVIFVIIVAVVMFPSLRRCSNDSDEEAISPPPAADTFAVDTPVAVDSPAVAAAADSALPGPAETIIGTGEGSFITVNGQRVRITGQHVEIDSSGPPVSGGLRMGPGAEIRVGSHRLRVGSDGRLRVDTLSAEAPVRRGTAGEDDEAFLPAEEAVWRPVRQWSGTGDRVTESFRVASREWRIVYGGTASGSTARQSVRVLQPSGRQVASVRRDGAGTDTSYVHRGPGVFYLEIRSLASRWNVSVQEKTVPAERITPP
ncbi:MAG TPA: hypothetical protein VFX98_09905 [Longimicrobiaceae bacterium]|nr:hypothetical protein [Longimicrobiaceae bacterium]